MAKKNVFICVKKDIVNPLSYAMKEFEDRLSIRYFDTTKQLEKLFSDDDVDCCALVLDSIIADQPTIDFAKELKGKKPTLKILLIVSAGTTKEELVKIIQTKTVSGVIIRPFTAEQVSDNIHKLCGFQKPTEVPWYMKTGL
jgi:DNA-binding NtrC family response regulator